MTRTEWVGGRIAAPLFVEDRGGFQADLVVWMDATRDLVVAMEAVHPSEPDSRIADLLRQAFDKPLAGPKQRPDQIRVAQAHLAEMLAPVAGTVPVEVAPTPEIERFVQVMGESMPGANPQLAAFRKLLREERPIMARMLPAMERLFRSAPWHLLWDSEVLQLDIPELDVAGWCVSVMGRAKQSWGLVLFRSAAQYVALRDVPAGHDSGTPVDLGAEALSLSFCAAGELPSLIRREITELGWDLASLDVYPLWLHATREGRARLPPAQDLRILLAAAVGVTEHVARHRDEIAAADGSSRTGEYPVETDTGVVTARITSPHPRVPWDRDRRPPTKAKGTSKARSTRKRPKR